MPNTLNNARLFSKESVELFAHLSIDPLTDPIAMREFIDSIKASFLDTDFQRVVTQHIRVPAQIITSVIPKAMVFIKTPSYPLDSHQKQGIREYEGSLTSHAKAEFNLFARLLRLSGLTLPKIF